jgi:hypothetical protein
LYSLLLSFILFIEEKKSFVSTFRISTWFPSVSQLVVWTRGNRK